MIPRLATPRPVAVMTFGITGPVEVRVLTANHTFTVGRNIAALTAIATLGTTDYAVASKLPAVILLVPMSALPLIPLVALAWRTSPLPAVILMLPAPALS